jgi:hypothetical protein
MGNKPYAEDEQDKTIARIAKSHRKIWGTDTPSAMHDNELKEELNATLTKANTILEELAKRGIEAELDVADISKLGFPARQYRISCPRLVRRTEKA